MAALKLWMKRACRLVLTRQAPQSELCCQPGPWIVQAPKELLSMWGWGAAASQRAPACSRRCWMAA